MPIAVARFKCKIKGCTFIRANSAVVEVHEKTCWKNPENRTCKTCAFKFEGLHPDPEKAHYVMKCAKDIQIPYNSAIDKQGIVSNCQSWEAIF